MEKTKKDLLSAYIKSGISPILLEGVDVNEFKNPVIIDSNCDVSLLNGHYEKEEFVGPKWYNELMKKEVPILIIKEINNVSKEAQYKFIEILKYKKISTFELPKNCIVIATCNDLKEKPISEDVYSLMVHI